MNLIRALALLVAVAGGAEARLEDTAGREVRLSSLRGRPAVLFYEDRDGVETNRPLKEELGRRADRLPGLARKVSLVPVADVGRWNFAPARPFALAAVRAAERKAGVRLLVDWDHSLSRALGLPLAQTTSSVVIVDAAGRPVWRHSGRLDAAATEAFFAALAAQLEAAG